MTECRCPIRGCGRWLPENEYKGHLSAVHRQPWMRPAEVAERDRGDRHTRRPCDLCPIEIILKDRHGRRPASQKLRASARPLHRPIRRSVEIGLRSLQKSRVPSVPAEQIDFAHFKAPYW